MLGILEYGAGNQTSVWRALSYLGIEAIVTADKSELASCEGIIFPGVGSAGQAMRQLQNTALDKVLVELVQTEKPLLGICLGCQILLESSEEESQVTLGLLKGSCKRFDSGLEESPGKKIRIPHMGWNSLNFVCESPLLKNISEDSEFYFVHSYYTEPARELIIATSCHGKEFAAVYGRNGLWGVQFHPEKSGGPGLKLLENFYAYCLEQSHGLKKVDSLS